MSAEAAPPIFLVENEDHTLKLGDDSLIENEETGGAVVP